MVAWLFQSAEHGNQVLKLITRNEQDYEEKVLDAVRFVPLLDGSVP